jgi:hypothetical protein
MIHLSAKLGRIDLTETEEALLREIVFDPPTDFGPDKSYHNGELATALLKSLMERKAIPQARLRYFADPAYHAENTKSSRYELFLRKVRSDEEMYCNPHFLKYLRYFIEGAQLPELIQETFYKKAQEHFIKVGELSSFARGLVREMRRRADALDSYKLPDNFYKLALDCGCDAGDAQAIRRAVMQVK